MAATSFERVVEEFLEPYQGTSLAARWREAVSFGQGTKATSYWIRDADDVVNVVWLAADGIRDITYRLPKGEPGSTHGSEAMFNFLPLRNIATFEVREGPGVANVFGLDVIGDKLVHVIPKASAGVLFWVPSNEEEAKALDIFLAAVLTAFATATS